MMPGKKDFVSVRSEEGRVHVQKRLVLTNLKEVYLLFKERFPTEKIGRETLHTSWGQWHSFCMCLY